MWVRSLVVPDRLGVGVDEECPVTEYLVEELVISGRVAGTGVSLTDWEKETQRRMLLVEHVIAHEANVGVQSDRRRMAIRQKDVHGDSKTNSPLVSED